MADVFGECVCGSSSTPCEHTFPEAIESTCLLCGFDFLMLVDTVSISLFSLQSAAVLVQLQAETGTVTL